MYVCIVCMCITMHMCVPIMFAKEILVVTKQLSASLAISAEADDMRQMRGEISSREPELARSCTAWCGDGGRGEELGARGGG